MLPAGNGDQDLPSLSVVIRQVILVEHRIAISKVVSDPANCLFAHLCKLDMNALANPSPIPGIRHGKGALGRRGWAGPMPPRSHGPHAYVFQLFALDQAPGLPASFTLDDVIAAIKDHAIGRARLVGTYEIR